MKAKVSLKYSVNSNNDEFDIEDIPLISFLTDRRLKSLLKQLSSLPKLLVKANEKPSSSQDKEQTVKIAISSEQNIEKTMSANNTAKNERVWTEVSDSSVPSLLPELPTKKLILHRFRSREFHTPLQEQSANIDPNSAGNFAERMEKKAAVLAKIKRQKQIGKLKRVASEADKENAFPFNLEQVLNIELNTKFKLSARSEIAASRLLETRRL